MTKNQNFILSFIAIVGGVVVLLAVLQAFTGCSDRNRQRDTDRFNNCLHYGGSWVYDVNARDYVCKVAGTAATN